MKRPPWPLFALVVAAGGCERQDMQLPKSLVGAYDTPKARLLTDETQQINLNCYHDGTGIYETLVVEIRPDNSVVISRNRRFPIPARKENETKELRQFRISTSAAAAVRGELARLRPEHLTPEMAGSLPAGCQYICDGGAAISVAYWDNHRRLGAFELQDGCNSPNVPAIKRLVRNVLGRMKIAPEAYGFSISG